jgi:hypothetical protein
VLGFGLGALFAQLVSEGLLVGPPRKVGGHCKRSDKPSGSITGAGYSPALTPWAIRRRAAVVTWRTVAAGSRSRRRAVPA